jgi:hypothetical protein
LVRRALPPAYELVAQVLGHQLRTEVDWHTRP